MRLFRPTTVFQNEFLPTGAREAHAVISISSTTAVEVGSGVPEMAVVILLDCSGSMGKPWGKLRAARRATEAAVDGLRDGTWFAVVRGNHDAAHAILLTDGQNESESTVLTNAIMSSILRTYAPSFASTRSQVSWTKGRFERGTIVKTTDSARSRSKIQ